jgi:hypothetical protein
VCNGHIEATHFLLNQKINVNSADNKGRTPLMEASLWGHVEIVDILLKAGADRTMVDRQGMTAADLADESDTNDEERHIRHMKYSEDPFVKKRHRRLIRGLLNHGLHGLPSRQRQTVSLDDLTDAFFYKSKNASAISFLVPTAGIRISTQSKTAAFLHRGTPFPVVAAVSGWTGRGDGPFLPAEAGLGRLDAGYWTAKVLRLVKEIDYSLSIHPHDKPDEPGSYYACHAESQLMCFFIDRNFIFPDYDEGDTVDDDFLQMFLLQERVHHAQIIVSQPPCESCAALASVARWRLGIQFDIKVINVR